MFFDVAVYVFDVAVHIFFDVAVHIFRCCSTYFSMLQCMFFNVALHIISMLQYLQPDVALHSFSICFAMLQLMCFILFWDRGAVGNGCVGERRTWEWWGAEDMGGFRSIPFYTRGAGGVP